MSKIDETLEQHQHYKQECNVPNRTIFCHDNLEVLRGINSECIDLIYLDPPFNKKKTFTAPIGSSAEGASFKDIFTQEDVKEDWVKTIEEDHYAIHELLNAVKRIEGRESYNFCYLAYMAIRLIECYRVLKDTGSLYLHCDPTMSHYLKLLLDCIFGENNFRNEITWRRQTAKKGSQYEKKTYGTQTDCLFFYTKKNEYYFSIPKTPLTSEELLKKFNKVDNNRRRFRTDHITLVAGMRRKNLIFKFDGFTPKYGWMMNKEKLTQFKNEDRIYWSKQGKPYRKYFMDEYEGKEVSNIWLDIHVPKNDEAVKYPTQKPLALLERIITASSNKEDIVLDPFCGCATTCVAAEKLGRHWIGIDISLKAYELVQQRIKKEVYDQILLKGKDADAQNSGLAAVHYPDIIFRTSPPKRTDSDTHIADTKYIYVISHPNYENEYKVGIASDPKSRLTAYQTSDPERSFHIEYTLRVSNYRQLERHIHDTFENKHEWVRGDLQDIIAEIEAHADTPNRADGVFGE